MPHANDRGCSDNVCVFDACAFAKRSSSRSPAVALQQSVTCSGLAGAGADPGFGDGDGWNNSGSGLAATVHPAAARHLQAAFQARDAPHGRLSETAAVAADALVLLASSAGGGGAGAVRGKGASCSNSLPPHTVALSFGSWGRQTGPQREQGHGGGHAIAVATAGGVRVTPPLPAVVAAADVHPQQRGVPAGATLLGKRRSSITDNHSSGGGASAGAMGVGPGGCAAVAQVPHSTAVLAAMAAVAAAGARGAASRCFKNTSIRPLAAATTISHGQALAAVADEAEADAAAAAGEGAGAHDNDGDGDGDGGGAMRMLKYGRQQRAPGRDRGMTAAAAAVALQLPQEALDLGAAGRGADGCGTDGEAEDAIDAQQQQPILLVEEMVERASSLCSTAAGGARHAPFGRGNVTCTDPLLLPPPAPPLLLNQFQQQHAHTMAQLLLGGVGAGLQPRRISHLAAPPAAAAGPSRGLLGMHASEPLSGACMPCRGAAPAGAMAGAQAAARGLRFVGGGGSGAAGAGVAAMGQVPDLGAASVSAEHFEGRLEDLLRGCGSGDEAATLLLHASHCQQHSAPAARPAARSLDGGVAGAAAAAAVARPPLHPRGLLPLQQQQPAVLPAATWGAATSPAGNDQASAALPPPVPQQQGQQGQEPLGEDPRSTEELLALGREVASRLMRVQRAKESLRRMEGSLVAEARNLRLLLHQRRCQQLELQQQVAPAAATAADAEAAARPLASELRRSEVPADARRMSEAAAAAADTAIRGLPAGTAPAALKLVLLGAAADSANAAQTATVTIPAAPVPVDVRATSAALRTGTPPASPLARSAATGAATSTAVPSFARKSTDSANTSRRTGTSPVVLLMKLGNSTGTGAGVAGVGGREQPATCNELPTAASTAAAATTADAPISTTDRRGSRSSQEKGLGGAGSAVPSAGLLKAALAVTGIQSAAPAEAAPLVDEADKIQSPRPSTAPAGDSGAAALAAADGQGDTGPRDVKRVRVC
ncbi:hypothetical protein HYH02_000356 [Chlamydomonas schloesseri]|uniref:Uncharacterized protein n=1 Tax=Chlamydomonas schloesseri TaxID=2026947 RepID=A0A836BD85_9CHLO|nr:hypothetical protein HYH02_000356 [Chlamydomonas schloesseri]|eukprot:KAG2454509.1 hypothetical protein HYH02_000356 [Chlamydomonas schloesseri]